MKKKKYSREERKAFKHKKKFINKSYDETNVMEDDMSEQQNIPVSSKFAPPPPKKDQCKHYLCPTCRKNAMTFDLHKKFYFCTNCCIEIAEKDLNYDYNMFEKQSETSTEI